jgi:hypothetical protein
MQNTYKRWSQDPTNLQNIIWDDNKFKNYFRWCCKNAAHCVIPLLNIKTPHKTILKNAFHNIILNGDSQLLDKFAQFGITFEEKDFFNFCHNGRVDMMERFIQKYPNKLQQFTLKFNYILSIISYDVFLFFLENGLTYDMINIDILHEPHMALQDFRIIEKLCDNGFTYGICFLNRVLVGDGWKDKFKILEKYADPYTFELLNNPYETFSEEVAIEIVDILHKKGIDVLQNNQIILKNAVKENKKKLVAKLIELGGNYEKS